MNTQSKQVFLIRISTQVWNLVIVWVSIFNKHIIHSHILDNHLCGSVKTVVLKCLDAQNFLNVTDKDIVILGVAIILSAYIQIVHAFLRLGIHF
ncbi:hypothetical protein JOB18_002382 [Solea senegalensis]|nr:hypothetical protein JOB18_002382 [Solea senegalensis]